MLEIEPSAIVPEVSQGAEPGPEPLQKESSLHDSSASFIAQLKQRLDAHLDYSVVTGDQFKEGQVPPIANIVLAARR